MGDVKLSFIVMKMIMMTKKVKKKNSRMTVNKTLKEKVLTTKKKQVQLTLMNATKV